MSRRQHRHSRWTMPILRVGVGLFLALWGVDKLVATEGSIAIFDTFYGLDVGGQLVRAVGAAEILLGVLLAVGLFRVPVAWIALAVNAVSTLGSWRQLVDPWGLLGLTDGGAHLFLASIVVLAANVVIVLNARLDDWTLDGLRRGSGRDEERGKTIRGV